MLYVCPTPIGNLQDITLRALDVLARVDLVACEDTRRTRILLERHGITARLVSFHEHNEDERVGTVLPLLREGKDVAVVSDAGMPGLSDPGFTLVRACAAEGIPVTVLPGPSAVSTALVASGFPVDRFVFVGFLARSKGKLVEQVARFDGTGATVLAFESPRRVRAALAVIAERWPGREVAVCRELTKIHEEVVRGTAADVLGRLAEAVRGEIVLVLAPGRSGAAAPAVRAPGRDRLARGTDVEQGARAALADLEQLGMGTKKASAMVAGLSGLSPRRAYEIALEVKAGSEKEDKGRRRGSRP